MTKQEAREFISSERDRLSYANELAESAAIDFAVAIADYLLADEDEPTTPKEHAEWYRNLPDNTPVEVKVLDGSMWDLWYVFDGALWATRDGNGAKLSFDRMRNIRWPLPPDGWAKAHEQGLTYLILSAEGATWLTDGPEVYSVGDRYGTEAIIPIPEATE